MYEMSFDPVGRTLLITARGSLTLAVMAMFSVELIARITAIKLRHGAFVALVDVREVPVQGLDVTDAIEKLMNKAVTIVVVPTATVVGSYLGKLQADRCLKAGHCRSFLDIDAARAWLEEQRPAALAA